MSTELKRRMTKAHDRGPDPGPEAGVTRRGAAFVAAVREGARATELRGL